MEAKYTVLEKETVKKILTREEIIILDCLIDKVRKHEGRKVYVVDEVRD